MTIYLERLTVPSGTLFSALATQEIVVVPGSLHALRLYVPPGPRGEVALRLMHRGVQLLPARAGTWWYPDGTTLEFVLRPSVPIAEGDVSFFLQGAAPFSNYEHNVDFQLDVEPGIVIETSAMDFTELMAEINSL